MIYQKGSTLITALLILTIITLVAVYSLESSNIQAKMVSSSLLTNLTYQECRNEQEANVRYYNLNGGEKRNELIELQTLGNSQGGSEPESNTLKTQSKSDMSIDWSYIGDCQTCKSGVEITIDSPIRVYQYENNCVAELRFAASDQTLGVAVEGLKGAGNIK